METLIPLVKLKGKSLSHNGSRKMFYNDGYTQGRDRGAVRTLKGTPCWLQASFDLAFGWGLLLGGRREGWWWWGGTFPLSLFSPPSGRGFAGSQALNPRGGAGLCVLAEGHGSWQPQGWESSDAPAWSFPPPGSWSPSPTLPGAQPWDQECRSKALAHGVSC